VCKSDLVTSQCARMPPLSPEDKAYIVSQYYAGKTATQIQRKFKREKRKTFSLPTISTWLKSHEAHEVEETGV